MKEQVKSMHVTQQTQDQSINSHAPSAPQTSAPSAPTTPILTALLCRNAKIQELQAQLAHQQAITQSWMDRCASLEDFAHTLSDQTTAKVQIPKNPRSKAKKRMPASKRNKPHNISKPERDAWREIMVYRIADEIKRKRWELEKLEAELAAAQARFDLLDKIAKFYELLTAQVVEQTSKVRGLLDERGISPHDTVSATIYQSMTAIEALAIRAGEVANWDLKFLKRVLRCGTVYVSTNGDENNRPRRYVEYDGKYFSYARVAYQVMHGVVLQPDEEVHHADGDAMNDDPTNWQVMGFLEHKELHWGWRRHKG